MLCCPHERAGSVIEAATGRLVPRLARQAAGDLLSAVKFLAADAGLARYLAITAGRASATG
jgi:hypothetical protein